MAIAISNESTTRAAATAWITVRRPPAMRSMTGPMSGAMSRNGAKLMMRKSSTRPRAALGVMLKNSESARATIIAASPPIIAAWVMLRRRNLVIGVPVVIDADARDDHVLAAETAPIRADLTAR